MAISTRDSRLELVIVGSGVFGTCTAFCACRAGFRVTLIDQYGPVNDRSSSAGESRIIRSAYGQDEVYTLLAQRSLRLWQDLLKELRRPSCLQLTGVLWVGEATDTELLQSRRAFERHGITHEWLDSNAIQRRYPQIDVSPDSVALFEPYAGALLAEESVKAIFEAVMEKGARHEVGEVKPPEADARRLKSINTKEGRRIPGDVFVFACGSWLPKVFPQALDGIIRSTRQEHFFFDVKPGSDDFQPSALPIWIDGQSRNLAYGFPDLGSGVKLGFHRLGQPFDPDSGDRVVTQQQIREAAEYLSFRFPAMQGANVRETKVCHYENTPTGDFLIDRHPAIENVWFVGGGSGHGFKHAPAIGEYVVNRIMDRVPAEPRFSLEAKQQKQQRRVI